MALSRIPGEYEGDAYFPGWEADDWDLVDSVEYDEFTHEEWVRILA